MFDIDNTRIIRRNRIIDFVLPDHTKVARAFNNGQVVDYVIFNDSESDISIVNFLHSVKDKILSIFVYELDLKKAFKCNFSLSVHFINVIDVTMRFAYKTRNASLLQVEDSNDFIEDQFQALLSDVENRQLNKSGWSLNGIEFLEVRISRHLYLPGRRHIKLPKWISDKKALYSIKNNDDHCFRYAIVAIYLRKNGMKKINMKQIKLNIHNFNFKINSPPTKRDMAKFCTLNSASINVFGVEGKHFYPIILAKDIKSNHYNLLYYENGNYAHYFPILSLSRLVGSQINKSEAKKYFCLRCLLHFPSKERLAIHIKFCGDEHLAKIKLPAEKSFYKFDRFDAVNKTKIIITMDTESYLRPVYTCAPNPNSSFTNNIQKHELAAFAMYLYCEVDNDMTKNIPRGYYGEISKNSEELEDKMIKYFDKVARTSARFFTSDFPIHMSIEDEQNFREATKCFICYKPFTAEDPKIREHDHDLEFNNYRGSSHRSCNLLVRRKKFIPIWAHAMGAYDSHYLIRMFASRNFKIKLIPHNIERYISFSVWFSGIELRFNDSFLIFHDKLETVLSSLPHDKFIETKKSFVKESHDLIMAKLPFPYSYLSGPDSLDCTEYPDKKYFTNDLNGEEISNEQYEKGKKIWNVFKCKNFADFTSIYCMSDTIMLNDALLYFRKILYDSFGVELMAFYTLPQASISCMLKLSGVQIQVFDESMQVEYEMTQRALFGGLVNCNVRYTEASENKHISYIDANGLYAFISAEYKAALSDYTLVDPKSKDWAIAATSGEFGYLIECDFFFPDCLQDDLNCLVPAYERKCISGSNIPRLVSDFSPKKNSVITLQHYQLLLRLGVQITNISLVLRFKQDLYMSKFMQILNGWRKNSLNSFTSGLYKSIQNFCIGKLNENLVNRQNIEICTDPKRLDKLIRKGTFKNRHIYEYENFSMTLVEMAKSVVLMNRPIIVCAVIWNLSKVHMYDMWYFKMRPVFGLSQKLIFQDTDSFCFSYECDDCVLPFQKLEQYMDFSNLSPSHPLYNPKNKKVLGKFKFETGDSTIQAVVCVKSKVYSLLFDDSSCLNKLKGVQRNYVKRQLSFDDYKNCVLNNETKFAIYNSIGSKQHNIHTFQQCKLALQNSDGKRHILSDGINTKAHFHHSLKETCI